MYRGSYVRIHLSRMPKAFSEKDWQWRRGIHIQERDWQNLRDGFSPTGIVDDLFATFGELQINPFYMETAKKIIVTGGISSVGDARTALNAVCDCLGIPKRSQEFDAES